MVAAIGVTVCVAYLAGGARGIGVSERDRVFSPADPEAVQLSLPARDVPIDSRPTISNLAGRLSLDVALGRRTALRDLAAVATALAIAAFGVWLLAINIPLFITALAMLCVAMGPTFWGRGISWTHDALTPALALMALWATARWFSTRRRGFAAAAVAVAIAAVMDRRFDVVDSSTQVLTFRPVAEFTPLGVFLLVVGLVVLLGTVSYRLLVAVGWMCYIALAEAARDSPLDVVSLPLAIGGWTAVAIGLTWIKNAVSPIAGTALVTIIALLTMAEPALTRARLWTLGRDLPSEARTRLAADIRPADVPDRAVVVAEAHRADVFLRLGLTLARREAAFVPQLPDRIHAATGEGMTVLAFDRARANLERLGFLFERDWIGNTEVSAVAGHTPCIDLKPREWQDVSLLVATGSFVIHGSRPGAAPGGVVLRVSGNQPVQVSSIEPRSIPLEITGTDIRVPETTRIDPVIVTFASAPVSATATAEDGLPVRMCAGAQRGPLTLGRSANAAAALRMHDSAVFGTGWHLLEADPDFFRWTAASDALVRVSMAPVSPVRVTITATPASRPSQQPVIGLVVNTCRFPSQRMQAGQGDYEWVADASCWRPGMNHMWIAVTPLISPASLSNSHDTRLLGARIGAIRLSRHDVNVRDQKAK